MSEKQNFSHQGSSPMTEKRLLENPWVGSFVVPLAIVLVGALIIFGVTSLLSTDRSYKDLVREMQSKTFGNRWIAAYELSKVLATSSVPVDEIPWLVENLGDVYTSSADPRTREFVIAALGSLKNPIVLPYIYEGLKDTSENVQFHAIVSLGNMPKETTIDWEAVYPLLSSPDHAMRHSSVFALATHRVVGADEKILPLLNDDVGSVRYAAATALINYQREEALPILREILALPIEVDPLNPLNEMQSADLKVNIINLLMKEDWKVLILELENVAKQEGASSLSLKAQEALNQLKN